MVTRPISHQSAVVAHEAAQTTYVDANCLISSETGDVHDSLRSMSLPSSNPSESMTQDGKEMMAGRRHDSILGKLDDRHAVEQGYFETHLVTSAI